VSRVTRDRCYDFKNIFLPKKLAKKLAFLTQNKAKLCKILIITLVFEKNAIFFAENCRKSQKIVIITSTPALHRRYLCMYVHTDISCNPITPHLKKRIFSTENHSNYFFVFVRCWSHYVVCTNWLIKLFVLIEAEPVA
jgi:hypothetical protein